MIDSTAIAERWFDWTIASYPPETIPFLRGEQDRFRNPAGFALRDNLATLARQVFGAMDKSVIEPAIDTLVRLRAVQDFGSSEAVQFIFDLRAVVMEVSGSVSPDLDCRIEEMGLMACEQYMACRKQIAALRARELRYRTQCEAS